MKEKIAQPAGTKIDGTVRIEAELKVTIPGMERAQAEVPVQKEASFARTRAPRAGISM